MGFLPRKALLGVLKCQMMPATRFSVASCRPHHIAQQQATHGRSPRDFMVLVAVASRDKHFILAGPRPCHCL
jgi:hypothetical protein